MALAHTLITQMRKIENLQTFTTPNGPLEQFKKGILGLTKRFFKTYTETLEQAKRTSTRVK